MSRRHVVYVPGYDPRSPRAYFLLFRKELGKFAALNGVEASLERVREPALPERPAAEWRLVAHWPTGRVETTIEFLDWHDIAADDFAASRSRRAVRAAHCLWESLINGAIPAMWRLSWKAGLFAAYPWAMALLFALVAAAFAAAGLAGAERLGAPSWAGLAVAVLLVVALARAARRLDERFHVWYLVNAWTFTWRHRTGRHPKAENRIELFARHLVARQTAGPADETLIVAHSSGSIVAVAAVARALELDPTFGSGASPPILVTLGANLPTAAAGRDNPPIRRALAALVTSERVRWADYYAPQDVINFPSLDPVRAFGLDLGGRPALNPSVRSAMLTAIMDPVAYAAQRFRFYDRHFQFIRANDRPGEYDLYRFLAGPERFPWPA